MRVWSILLLITMGALLVSCSQDDSPAGPILYVSAGEKVFDSIEWNGQKSVSVANDSGGVYIYGYLNQPDIATLLYRKVSAAEINDAKARLGDISLNSTTSQDHIDIFTTINAKEGQYRYDSFFSLDLDRSIAVTLNNIGDDITVFDIDTTLVVNDAAKNVSLVRQTGSCDIRSLEGELYIEMQLPEDGFCRGLTNLGDIVVRIPKETSATLKATTDEGAVTLRNLDVNDKVESTTSVEGVLGNGDGEIVLHTRLGNIDIQGF